VREELFKQSEREQRNSCEGFFISYFRVGMKDLVQLNTFGRTRCAEALTPLNRKKGTVRLEQAVHSKQKIRHAKQYGQLHSFKPRNTLCIQTKPLSAYQKARPMLREQRPASFGSRAARCPSWLAPCVYVFNDLGMELCVLDEVVTDKPHGYHFRLNEK
jgi:hypothetical protein